MVVNGRVYKQAGCYKEGARPSLLVTDTISAAKEIKVRCPRSTGHAELDAR